MHHRHRSASRRRAPRPRIQLALATVVLLLATLVPATAANAAPPAAPTLVSITGLPLVNAKLRVTWSLVPDATDYVLWVSPNSGTGPYTPIYRAFGIASSIDIIDMTQRNPWYFTVTAENSSGESDRSNEIASAFPFGALMFFSDIPTVGDESLGIHWSLDSIWTSYTLHWGTTPGVYPSSVVLGGDTAPEYTIRGLTNGTRYYIKLTALDVNGASWASDEASAVPGLATTLTKSGTGTTAGGTLTANWSGVTSPSATDWIGLYATRTSGESQFIAWRYTSGTASGSVPLTIPVGTPAGTTYELRLFTANSFSRIAHSAPFGIAAGVVPTLSAPSGTPSAGSNVTVSWTGVTNATPTDWIGLYPTNSTANTAYAAWRYTTGAVNGSVTFALPSGLPNGTTYELRLFANDGYTRLATSAAFTIGGIPTPTIAASTSSVAAGGTLLVDWAGITGPSATDWIGLYPTSGTANTAFAAWRYTNGTATGTVAFTVPASVAPGTTYELRLFANDGYTRLATSGPVTVTTPTPPALSVGPATITSGLATTVNWSNIAGPNATDWIGLYASSSAADTAFLGWRYTTGTASGNVPFTIPQNLSGSGFELRLFSANSYTRLATLGSLVIAPGISLSLSATQSNLVAGGPVTANWSGRLTPTLTDWIGLYRTGTPDSAFVAWKYTTGTQAGNVTFTIPTGTAPGSYELRMFAADGFTLIGRSGLLTVT